MQDPDFDIYSAQLWPAAFAAATALLSHLAEGPGSIVELGCGPGMPSLAALAAGAPHVLATDWSPLALALVVHTATQFQSERVDRLSTAKFDVFDTEALLPPGWSYLVATDMLYESPTALALGTSPLASAFTLAYAL